MYKPPTPIPLETNAGFTQSDNPLDFSVSDFWQWAYSDLKMNDIRGILAEFLVAKALNIPLRVRINWDNYDHLAKDGLKIEVKCGGYLQSWPQKALSNIVFSGLRGQIWDFDNACYRGQSSYRADVYIFAVQTAKIHEEYDALNLDQWEYYVLPKKVLEKKGTKSMALSVVQKLAEPVTFSELKNEVSRLNSK